jgi:hypothetical protein
MPPGAFLLQGVRNALKNKGIGKTPEPRVRKRIEGKQRSGRENGATPEGLQEAVCLPHNK